MSSYRMVADFGYVVGPLLLGWIADAHSSEMSLFVSCGLFLVSCLLFALFAPRVRPESRRGAVVTTSVVRPRL